MSDEQQLKQAIEQIREIMRTNDVGGIIILANEHRMEHYTELSPSWSCATYDGEMVRFRALESEFNSKQEQKECIENTVGLMAGMADVCRVLNEQLNAVLASLSQKFDISHRTRRL